jgi:ABC-type nitrate/sulfonate/bicarbonate transport system substrate-binding protein
MPTWVNAHPWLAEAVKKAGGRIVRIGSKPWAHFNGDDANERAKAVELVYEQVHGFKCIGVKPWREDQQFDYAIRLD